MSHRAVAALSGTLRGHVGLGKSRLETLCMLVVGMIGARTVNLGHIASTGARGVQIASTYRRLQRFFQHVDLGPDWAAPIVARLIGPGAWTLALDRMRPRERRGSRPIQMFWATLRSFIRASS